MRKVKTPFSFQDLDKFKEQNSGEIVTVPGQSYSIAELLTKHKQGLLPDINRTGSYQDNPDFDDLDPMYEPDFDLVDAVELNRKTQAKIAAAKADKLIKDQEAKKQAKQGDTIVSEAAQKVEPAKPKKLEQTDLKKEAEKPPK